VMVWESFTMRSTRDWCVALLLALFLLNACTGSGYFKRYHCG
jgi:hypothetical protein